MFELFEKMPDIVCGLLPICAYLIFWAFYKTKKNNGREIEDLEEYDKKNKRYYKLFICLLVFSGIPLFYKVCTTWKPVNIILTAVTVLFHYWFYKSWSDNKE